MSAYDDPVMEATLAMLPPPSFDDIDMISYLDAMLGTDVSYDDKSPLHDLPIIYRLDPYGRALLWAVEQGHRDVVVYLLSEAVEPSTSVVLRK